MNADLTEGEHPMKPSEALASHRAAIRQVVAAHHARNVRVFGSVVHGEDTPGSDLDLLIDPTPETTLMDVAAIQVELQRLLGTKVDVVTPKELPESSRSQILAESLPV
jgi:predicted nucleotidyltransferase